MKISNLKVFILLGGGIMAYTNSYCGYGPYRDTRIILEVPAKLYSVLAQEAEKSRGDLDAILQSIAGKKTYTEQITKLLELNKQHAGYVAEFYQCSYEDLFYISLAFDRSIDQRVLGQYAQIFNLEARFPHHYGWGSQHGCGFHHGCGAGQYGCGMGYHHGCGPYHGYGMGYGRGGGFGEGRGRSRR